MKFSAAMAVALVLSACGAGSAAPAASNPSEAAERASAETATPSPSQPAAPLDSATPGVMASEECSEAFGAMLPELNSIEAEENRLPAIEACTSLDEWVAAGAEHPELVEALAGADWLEEPLASLYVLGGGCASLGRPAVGAPLCEQLAAWCESNVENLSQPPCQAGDGMSR